MNWLIVGSTATYHWFPDSRIPQDIDLLTPAKVVGNESKVCVVDCQWHEAAELLMSLNKDPVFMDPDLLYTLKVSHAHWNVKWDKTMYDVAFLQNKGCQLNSRAYSELVSVWTRVHGEKRVNMNQTMDTFFKDAVRREYDHEMLHELVAFNRRPMHEKIRPNLSNAWCSEEMFCDLTVDEQLQTALEEMLVTAIERSHLTVDSKRSTKVSAVYTAYKQLVTSMTKGWFARFLIMNRNLLLITWRPQWETQLNQALSKLPK